MTWKYGYDIVDIIEATGLETSIILLDDMSRAYRATISRCS